MKTFVFTWSDCDRYVGRMYIRAADFWEAFEILSDLLCGTDPDDPDLPLE